MNITVRVWRQDDRYSEGKMAIYAVPDISEHMSFLEMLDVLNERLTQRGDDPIAFDHDCREGICGACGLVINGLAHGPLQTTTCQLHMRSFKDGDVIDIEPWRAGAFPVVKDLVVDRSSFDRIIQAGGYISAPTGTAPDAHATPVPKTGRRPCVRRGDLHRLWCLRRRLPQRLGDAVHRRQDRSPRPAAARPA